MNMDRRLLQAIFRRTIREELKTLFEDILIEKPNGEMVLDKDKYIKWNDARIAKPSRIK